MKKQFVSPVCTVLLPQADDLLTLSAMDARGDGFVMDFDDLLGGDV